MDYMYDFLKKQMSCNVIGEPDYYILDLEERKLNLKRTVKVQEGHYYY